MDEEDARNEWKFGGGKSSMKWGTRDGGSQEEVRRKDGDLKRRIEKMASQKNCIKR